MLFKKNLPTWERIARGVAGALMIACGLAGPGIAGTPVGLIVAGSGVMTLITAFSGRCPACAIAGRQPQ